MNVIDRIKNRKSKNTTGTENYVYDINTKEPLPNEYDRYLAARRKQKREEIVIGAATVAAVVGTMFYLASKVPTQDKNADTDI